MIAILALNERDTKEERIIDNSIDFRLLLYVFIVNIAINQMKY